MDSLLTPDAESMPDGMGAVRLVFDNENDERIIIPGSPVFTSYNVIISDAKGIAADIAESLSSNVKTYILNEGDYTIEVEAFTSNGLAAVGEKAFRITAGQSTAAGVQLQVINFADATKQGTFSYDIALPASSYTTAAMTITARGSYGKNPNTSKTGSNIYNFLGSDNPIGSTPLDVGYYSVVIELKNGGNTVFYREVLHVYQNLTSHFEYAFAPPDPPVQDGDLVLQRYLNYTENPVSITNPDRGFYMPNDNCIVPPSGSTSGAQLQTLSKSISSVSVEPRISHMYFDLRNFSSQAGGTTRALTADALSYIRGTLATVRSREGVAIVRFVYHQNNTYNRSNGPEPTGNCTVAGHTDKNWIQYHIYQVKPILQEYEDIIMAVDGGFLGSWGEMHTTTMATRAANYVWLLDALLDAVPDSRSILVHAGGFLAWHNAKYGTNGTVSRGQNYTFNNIHEMPAPVRGTPAARFGMFNDSYSAGGSNTGSDFDKNNDNGSLSEGSSLAGGSYGRSRIITWIGNQNNFYGGETNDENNNANYTRFPFVAWEALRAHTSHLNADHYSGVLNIWGGFTYNEGNVTIQLNNSYPAANQRLIYDPVYNGKRGIEFVRDRLGYRLVLRDAQVSDPVARSGTLVFKGKMQNVGWGNVINKKNVYVILRNKSSGTSYTRLTDLDARDWLAAADYDGRASNTGSYRDLNFTVNMSAFGNVPAGDYNIYLKIQDPKETIAARRCIRFANIAPNGVAIWDTNLGANLIGSVTVTNQ